MTMASLTASLLARKGQAQPSASARDIFAPDSAGSPDTKNEKRQRPTAQPRPLAPKGGAGSNRADTTACSAATEATEPVPPRQLFAANEARQTRLAQTDGVAPLKKHTPATIPSPPAAAMKKNQKSTPDARKHKSFRLDAETDTRLRLLAARKGTSQQALMEQAVRTLLKTETVKGECICGSAKG